MKNMHGGDIYTEGLLEGRQLIDFSSNINPLGVPEAFKNHIAEGVEALNRYPDSQYRQLKKYILEALKLQLDSENIILGNGAVEVLDVIISCFKTLLIAVPSFIEYEQFAKKWGCNIEYSYHNSNMDYDYEDIFSKLQSSEAMIIGNPNNPDGGVINKEKFIKILQYAENNSKRIIIDEAFIEFTAEESLSFNNELKHYNCLIII
jgi:threonine-phosphate decarboxylase